MPRALRIEYPGAVYHVYARGNKKSAIFSDKEDRKRFLSIFSNVVKNHNWLCHTYCQMGNHYHLLVETPDANLSAGMHDLNGSYATFFNNRHSTVGHLFQGRFKFHVIEKDAYLLKVAAYIVLNSVRAGLVKNPADWPWSSYGALAGLCATPDFLTTDWILGVFSNDRKRAQDEYKDFVRQEMGAESPFEKAKHQVIVGSPQFVHEMWEQVKDSGVINKMPREQRMVGRPELEDIFCEVQSLEDRDKAIVFARMCCGYTVAEIARHLGLSQTHVSLISREKR